MNKTDEEQLVTFGDGSTLTVDSYPSSDAAAQEAVVKTASAITRDEVVKALRHDQPPDGCGIDWSQLSKGGANATGDFKVSGTTCTTDLHIKMLNGSVTYLIIAYTQYIVLFMLYNRIAVLRSERSLSRADLAKAAGVNVQTIGFLERGDYSPSLELAFKISGYFKLPVEAVFSPKPFRPLSEQVYEMHWREA